VVDIVNVMVDGSYRTVWSGWLRLDHSHGRKLRRYRSWSRSYVDICNSKRWTDQIGEYL